MTPSPPEPEYRRAPHAPSGNDFALIGAAGALFSAATLCVVLYDTWEGFATHGPLLAFTLYLLAVGLWSAHIYRQSKKPDRDPAYMYQQDMTLGRDRTHWSTQSSHVFNLLIVTYLFFIILLSFASDHVPIHITHPIFLAAGLFFYYLRGDANRHITLQTEGLLLTKRNRKARLIPRQALHSVVYGPRAPETTNPAALARWPVALAILGPDGSTHFTLIHPREWPIRAIGERIAAYYYIPFIDHLAPDSAAGPTDLDHRWAALFKEHRQEAEATPTPTAPEDNQRPL